MKIPVLSQPEMAPRPVGTPFVDAHGATPEAFGAGIGQGIQDAAAVAQRFTLQAKQSADATASMAAASKLSAGNLDDLHNADTGFLTKQGNDAIAGRAAAHKSLDERAKSLSDGLANDDQRAAFAHLTRAQIQQDKLDIERHVQDANKVVDLATFGDSYKVALDRVSADPSQLDAQVQGMAPQLAVGAQRTGKPLNVLTDEFKRDAAEAAMKSRLRAEDIAGATTLLKEYPALAQYSDNVKRLVETQQSTQLGEEFVAKSLLPSGRVDDGKLLKLLDAMPEGSLRDYTRSRANARASDVQKAWRDKADILTNAVKAKALNVATGRIDLNLADANQVAELKRVDPPMYETLRKTSAITAKSDLDAAHAAVYNQFGMDMGNPTTKAEIANLDLKGFRARYEGLVNQNQMSIMVGRFQHMQAHIDRLPEETLVLGRVRTALRLGPKDPIPTDQMPFFSAYLDGVREQTRAMRKNGQEPTPEQMQKILNDQETEVVKSPGFLWDTMQPAYEARAEAKAASATSKTVKAYRYSTDKTKRIPVYSDGTEGPVEANQ